MDYSKLSDEEFQELYEDDQRQQRMEWMETALDGVSGFAQGATFNFGDEIYSATEALGKGIGETLAGTDRTFSEIISEEYNKVHAMEQIRMANVQERSPIAATTGELAAMAPFFAKLVATKAPVLMSGALGTVQGFGSGDGLENSLQQAAVTGGSTMLGAGAAKFVPIATEKVGTGTVRVLAGIADKIFPKGKMATLAGKTFKGKAASTAVAGAGTALTGALIGNPLMTVGGLAAVGTIPLSMFPKTAITAGGMIGNRLAGDVPSNDFGFANLTDDQFEELYQNEMAADMDFSQLSDAEFDQRYNEEFEK